MALAGLTLEKEQSLAIKILIDIEVAAVAAKTMIRDDKQAITHFKLRENKTKQLIQQGKVGIGAGMQAAHLFPERMLQAISAHKGQITEVPGLLAQHVGDELDALLRHVQHSVREQIHLAGDVQFFAIGDIQVNLVAGNDTVEFILK